MSSLSSNMDPSLRPLSSEFCSFEMDRGRLAIYVSISPLYPCHNDLLKQAARIMKALQDKDIFCYTLDINDSLMCFYIPLKSVHKETSIKTLKCALEALKVRSIIDSIVQKEVFAIFKALHSIDYSGATSPGITPPDLTNVRTDDDYQSVANRWWGSVRGMPFQTIPKPYQNVVLYDAFRSDSTLSPTDKFNQHLNRVARSKDFFTTLENINLLSIGFPFEELIFEGPGRLNPIDHALRGRNAGLLRALMIHAESDWKNVNDTRKFRALLNSILLEIETGSRTITPVANSGAKYSRFLKMKGFTRNLSYKDQKNLDITLDKLVSSAVEVYAFLLLTLSPGGTVGTPVLQNEAQFHPLWMQLNLNSVHGDKVSTGLYDHFSSYSNLGETINALIIDRILKFIIKADPTITDEVRVQIFKISEEMSFNYFEKALVMASDPTSELSKKFSWQMAFMFRHYPALKQINQVLGQKFTKNYGSKWCRYLPLKNTLTTLASPFKFELEGFILNEADKEWFKRRLNESGLKNYEFIKFPGNVFRLAIVLPEDFQARSSPSTDEDLRCPSLLNEWRLDEHMKLGVKPASAQASTSSSTSSTSAPIAPAQFPPEQKMDLATGYLKKAEAFLEKKSDVKALNSLDALIALKPEDQTLMGKALYLKASAQYKRMYSQEAIDTYKQLFELKESNLEKRLLDRAHFECGAAYQILNQLDEASEQYGIVISNPSADNKAKADALMNRAAIFKDLQDLPAAIGDTEHAIKVIKEGKLDSDFIEMLEEQIKSWQMSIGIPPAGSQSNSQSLGGLTGLVIKDR